MSSWIAILIAWLFVAVPRPECVLVHDPDPAAGLTPHPTARNVDITVTFRGQPAGGASILLYPGEGQLPKQISADSQGIAHLRDLQAGKNIMVATHKFYTTRLLLIASVDSDATVTGLSMEVFKPAAQDFARIKEISVTEHLPRFAGTVMEPSGGAVIGAAIEIYPDGIADPGQVVVVWSDDSGHFSADLPSGVYRALIREHGFKVYQIGFEIEEKAAAKNLSPVLQIGNVCSPT